MASNATKARPYRKASEYLVQARRRPESLEPKSPLEIENEDLRQKVHALTRKCEHSGVEYMQSKEYMENQLDQVQDKYDILNRNYSKLKTQFEALTNAARQLSEKNTKISRLESEKLSLVKDIDDLTQRVSEGKNSYFKLQQENERLRKDCNLAVQLLRCNKSNYQVQKREELPVDLRKRVDETSVSMEGYNEYINPYGDCDSDEGADEDVTSYTRDNNLDAGIGNSTSTIAAGPGEVSVDVLANVLEKAENVHMNLEESAYISDHQLNSSYTARFLDRRLIKVDKSNGDLERSKLPPPPVSTAPQPQESSPWELQTPSSLSRPTKYTDPDHMDESAAAAYGVYSLPLKRRNREHMASQHAPLPPPLPPQPTTTQPTTSLSSPSLLAYTSPPPPHNSDVIEERASSPDDFQFRRPLNAATNKSSSSSSKVAGTDMTSTTNQKSPRHKTRKEKASHDEKASLLLVDESDSDDVIGDSTMKLEVKLVMEEHLEVVEVVEEEDEVKGGVDLEWDSTLHHPPPLDDYQEDHADSPAVDEDVKDDLLLSYHDVTVVDRVTPQVAISLDDIFGPDDAEADRLKELLASPTEQHATDEGAGSSLLESLIESPPPPPMQFAADETDTTEVERDSDELRSSSTRRRNTSMERAQEFGNVLD